MKNDTTETLNPNKKGAMRRIRIFDAVLTYAAAILALGCLIGIIACVLMLNFGERSEGELTVLYILTGSFAGGAAVFALLTVLFSKVMSRAAQRELDFRERLDGEESFFVGDGTLLTFGEKGVTLHGETAGEHEPVFVPYEDTRYISICTRRRPREKGSWCVAIEMPVKYLSKKKDGKGDEKVLVQADAKDRLYESLKKHDLVLLGEEPSAEKEDKKFLLKRKFTLPNRRKRRNALILLIAGAVLAVASVFVGIFWKPSVGALAGALGCVLLFRGTVNFLRAKAVFGVYEEGIFWRESSGTERLFLKWDDIESVAFEEKDGYPVLVFRCSYGRYAIPAVEGAYESIKEIKEEKCTVKE